jgi:uncharacterized protein YbjT (DUF2867 family)
MLPARCQRADEPRCRGSRGAFWDVEVVLGDFTAPNSLRDALAGVDRVFLTSANGPDEVAHEAAVIDAIVAASVRLLVKLSALGAQVGSPLPGLDWNGQIEQHLRQSGVPAVVLQSNLFMSNLFASADAVAAGALPAPAVMPRSRSSIQPLSRPWQPLFSSRAAA